MKICVECYKRLYKNRSQVIEVSKEIDICEKCEKEGYVVIKDYPGQLIMSSSAEWFYDKKD